MQVMPSTKAQELLAASKDDEDMRAAERASKQLLASILGKKASAAAPTQQFYSVLLAVSPAAMSCCLSCMPCQYACLASEMVEGMHILPLMCLCCCGLWMAAVQTSR